MKPVFRLYQRLNQSGDEDTIRDDLLEFIAEFSKYTACLQFLHENMFTKDNAKYVYVVKKYINDFVQSKRCMTHTQVKETRKFNRRDPYVRPYMHADGNTYTTVWYKYAYKNNEWHETAHRATNECSY